MVSRVQVLIVLTRGESTSTLESIKSSTLLRSNGIKVITVYVGADNALGYREQRQLVTNVGELASLRVDRVDMLINRNHTNLLQRAADIPAPITG